MISVYELHEGMKLFPPNSIRIKGKKKVIEGVDSLGNTFPHLLTCATPNCRGKLPTDAVCLHFVDNTVLTPCYECEDFTLFTRPGGI